METYEKLRAYYPSSKYVGRLETGFVGRKQKEEKKKEEERKQIETKYGIEIGSDGRYLAYSKRIVLDTKTGLKWFAGPDRDTTWSEAKSWAESQSIDDESCRMPTIKEIRTLYQEGEGVRNMTPLLEINGWWVWSGD